MNESSITVSLGFREILPFLEDTEPISENMKQFVMGCLAKSMERTIYIHFFDALDNLNESLRQNNLKPYLQKYQKLEDKINQNLAIQRTSNNEVELDCKAEDLEKQQDSLNRKIEEVRGTNYISLIDIWDYMAMIYHYQCRLNDRTDRYPYEYYVKDDLLLGFIFDEFKLRFNSTARPDNDTASESAGKYPTIYQICYNEYINDQMERREGKANCSHFNESEKEKSFRTYFRAMTFDTYHGLYLPSRKKYYIDAGYDRVDRSTDPTEKNSDENPHGDPSAAQNVPPEDPFYSLLVNKSYDKLINEAYRYNKIVRTNRYVSSTSNLLTCFGITAGDAILFSEIPEMKYVPRNKDQLYILCILLGCSFETFNQLRQILTYEYNDENLFADNRLTTRDKLIQSVIRTYDSWCITVKNEFNQRHQNDENEHMRKYDEWDPECKYLPFLILVHIDKRIARSCQAEMERKQTSINQYEKIDDLAKFELCIGSHLLLHNFMKERGSRITFYSAIFNKAADPYFEDRKQPKEKRSDRREICDFIFDAQEKYILDKSKVKPRKGQISEE